MKVIILLALVGVALSAKLDNLGRSASQIGVVRDDSVAPVGARYRTSFQTDNGITIEEEGSEGSVGQTVVRGSYSYTAPDGQVITINYVADENGYRATGPSIPTLKRTA
ncbi:larval cuticle protein LCP-17 [Hyalella azteca]|uniref:Larval cuticle protein LCP-17 n=1 Tax=Hyalella azteca TaxID=294128 RepID=A0A8B7N601_HYAAZ|nr:larval cuticle protein LCP-17 [Hyalella azteca]